LVIFAAVLAEIIIILFAKSSHLITLNEGMFYWLFAASSQSMAALFAVLGMFAVFRYQILESRLRNLYDSLKNKFNSDEWRYYFGMTNADCWEDALIANKAEENLNSRANKLPKTIEHNLRVDILIIRSHEKARDYVLLKAKIPLISVLTTFMMAIFFLPFSGSIAKNFVGLIILMIILIFITFSMITILYFLLHSIAVRGKK
jgi:hypothetical protein